MAKFVVCYKNHGEKHQRQQNMTVATVLALAPLDDATHIGSFLFVDCCRVRHNHGAIQPTVLPTNFAIVNEPIHILKIVHTIPIHERTNQVPF